VKLTEAGRVFAEEARRVLADVELAVGETRRAGGASYSLRIACVPHLPIERLLTFLEALHTRSPGLRPQVTHVTSGEQVARLRSGELDGEQAASAVERCAELAARIGSELDAESREAAQPEGQERLL
jgi:DNA-binding transcriptional LysR family regulator